MQNKYIAAIMLVALIFGGSLIFINQPQSNTQTQSTNPPPPPASTEATNTTPPAPQNINNNTENNNSESKKPMNETTTASGLKKEILKEGTGAEAKAGDTVQVHYTGTLENGSKFDSSLDRGTPFSFKLGSGMVIKGWDEGVAGMKVGEKVKLTIPSSLGYGDGGYPPVIPAKATLIFEIELLKIN